MRSSESVTPPPLQAVPAAPLHPAGECEGLRGVLCQVTREKTLDCLVSLTCSAALSAGTRGLTSCCVCSLGSAWWRHSWNAATLSRKP